jgi:hypothetical protein
MTFKGHWATQIDVERFVSNPHRTATQLDRFSIFSVDQLIVLKSLRCLVRWRLDGIVDTRRLARLNPSSESLTQQAHGTGFQRSRKLIPAIRAGVSGSALIGVAPFQPQATPPSTEWC